MRDLDHEPAPGPDETCNAPKHGRAVIVVFEHMETRHKIGRFRKMPCAIERHIVRAGQEARRGLVEIERRDRAGRRHDFGKSAAEHAASAAEIDDPSARKAGVP